MAEIGFLAACGGMCYACYACYKLIEGPKRRKFLEGDRVRNRMTENRLAAQEKTCQSQCGGTNCNTSTHGSDIPKENGKSELETIEEQGLVIAHFNLVIEKKKQNESIIVVSQDNIPFRSSKDMRLFFLFPPHFLKKTNST